jgi:hypothetical protein
MWNGMWVLTVEEALGCARRVLNIDRFLSFVVEKKIEFVKLREIRLSEKL